MECREIQFIPQGTVRPYQRGEFRTGAEKHREKLARKVKRNYWKLALRTFLGIAGTFAFFAVLAWANWNVPIELI